jgi:hypothetical protein
MVNFELGCMVDKSSMLPDNSTFKIHHSKFQGVILFMIVKTQPLDDYPIDN